MTFDVSNGIAKGYKRETFTLKNGFKSNSKAIGNVDI